MLFELAQRLAVFNETESRTFSPLLGTRLSDSINNIVSGAMMLQTVFEIHGRFYLDLLHQMWQVLHDKKQILRIRLVHYSLQVLQVIVNDTICWESEWSQLGQLQGV